MSTVDETLALPPAPAVVPHAGFPLLATVAPLVAAGVIWMVTGSAFALIFAVLSPIIAVASMFDSKRSGRKRRRAETASHTEAVALLRTVITERQSRWRDEAWQHTPSARNIVLGRAAAARWRQTDATLVALGTGPAPSGIRLGGATAPNDHRELREWAATVTGAPIVVDLTNGLGIVGPIPLAAALARAVFVQLCFALPPTELGVSSESPTRSTDWDWVAQLPHVTSTPSRLTLVLREAAEGMQIRTESTSEPRNFERGTAEPRRGRLLLALATRLDDLPPGCGTVVRVGGPVRAQIIRSPNRAPPLDFCPELLARAEAVDFAVTLAGQARAAGLVTTNGVLPTTVPVMELLKHVTDAPASDRATAPPSLECPIGVGRDGPVRLDLVQSGPHAVVGGTTGSGKSELLTTWVAALAAIYSPSQVNFLLVDFKGGAAFQPLGRLPHCVGLITDLDSNTAARALASLGAELRSRELLLSAAGARDVTDVRLEHPLPRLIIVVDEFATMLGVFPELHALFVDIAARGRSLGVHLILCTQRPAGVVRDALLANCSLRLSLRVNNRADSQAVIGTDAAAALAPNQPGRCIVATESGEPVLCQVATTGDLDIASIAAAALSARSLRAPRRPWLDALPSMVTTADLRAADLHAVDAGGAPALGYPLGLLDEPERQRYRVFAYHPETDGHLLVVGGAGSGKSTLLHTLARVAEHRIDAQLVTANVESAWDALASISARVETGQQTHASPRLVLLDDFDSVCARWQPDHRLAAVDLLIGLLRDGPAAGVHVVVAVQRHTSVVAGLAALCQSTLLLKLPSVQDHLAAGGQSAGYNAGLPPGGGVWRTLRVQLLAPASPAPSISPPAIAPLPAHGPLLIVSSSPAGTATRLRGVLGVPVIELAGTSGPAASALLVSGEAGQTDAAGRLAAGQLIVVGDAETWQVHWTLLARLRGATASGHASLVFDRCSLSDFRLLSHRRELPPPLAPGRGRVWVLHPDGEVTRAIWPEPALNR
ncbi:S-DNA-T family DNA segregation ATPase FtsK/SpoIIIE [Cryobacterium sp. CAN_C3]|uniref:FtsK/SpoIIIE domain-containing protein n=1 Tax=unclassified Cryobacterium TaxID=2649013 RepID=UPI0018C932FD|nr:FtsK/SpoIIIE domain-containing protein [Cryobacterium sp. CAN_C3]MEC5155202.1 S-DNA-T family DNA segregation ATPase FtsK/SpoIIIE [Cryobacterium sp. CAN_C3]